VTKIHILVEGDGEVAAAKLLVRRILFEKHERYEFQLETYNASGRGNLTTDKGLEFFLNRLRRDKDCGAVLILLDAEKEDVACPPRLAKSFAEQSQKLNLPFPVVVVVAVCEYESWFLANLESIAPKYGIEAKYEGNPEEECSAKGWLERQMPKDQKYRETVDQEKMSQLMNIEKTYEACRSFKRLVDALGELLKAIDEGKTSVTPLG
jgi:hypothetical protein